MLADSGLTNSVPKEEPLSLRASRATPHCKRSSRPPDVRTAPDSVRFCVSAPIDTPTLSPFPTLPLARSLAGNRIGKEGVTALAAILKETKITDLKCAAAPEVFAFVSALTRLLSHCPYPSLAVSEATTSEPRAPLRWQPSSTRRRWKITNLKCAAASKVFAFVSAYM